MNQRKITIECHSVRSGFTVRQLIVNKDGRLHRHFIVDAKGCTQWYDPSYSKDLIKLTFDVLQSEVMFTHLNTMTRCNSTTIRDLKYSMDNRILEWMRAGDNDDLIRLYGSLTGLVGKSHRPIGVFDSLKDVYQGWSSETVLKGVKPSFNAWLDGEIFAKSKFVKSMSSGTDMYISAEPLILLDELDVNLCGYPPSRRNYPRYEALLRVVGDSRVALTLLNSRIRHSDMKEHQGIPRYLILTALRYNDVTPNQFVIIFRGDNDANPEVIERYSHDANYSVCQTVIPRTPDMTKVVIVTRKPVIHTGVRQSVGFYVDVYHGNIKVS